MSTEIRGFKLNSGEELVASVISTKTDNTHIYDGFVNTAESEIISYCVRRPLVLRFQNVSPGQLGLVFMPWLFFNPEVEEVEIPASAVLTAGPVSSQVETQYLQQTSGIELIHR